MSISRFGSCLSLAPLFGVFVLFAGCSSDAGSAPAPPGSGGSGAEGGSGVPQNTGGVPQAGSGGTSQTPPTGGAPAATGGSSSSVGGDLSVTECPGAMGYDLSLVQSMPECPLCANARCVPSSLVPAGQSDLLAPCDDANTCVPEGYAVTGGSFLAKTCASLEYMPGQKAEGRCISVCVPAVSEQLDRLPQDVCASGERCAPCWEPIDGDLTGACGIGCDTWTPGAPQRFEECGADDQDPTLPKRGICVPPELVPDNLRSAVPVDTCTSGWLCAPKEKARDLNYKFPPCAPAVNPLPPDPNQPAACVPRYIALNNPSGGLLAQTSCAAGELCAPCTNPLDGTNTGACD
jgi:hypothetical protein